LPRRLAFGHCECERNKMLKRKPDFIIGQPDDPYLLRWWVIPRNRWFNIYLHKFLRSDDDRATHDHPWPSCSIILKGGYWEHVDKGFRGTHRYWRSPGTIRMRKASSAHRIELKYLRHVCTEINPKVVMRVKEQPAWTIFITGPKIREWGFHCPNGWKHWREFCGVTEGEAKGDEKGPGCL